MIQQEIAKATPQTKVELIAVLNSFIEQSKERSESINELVYDLVKGNYKSIEDGSYELNQALITLLGALAKPEISTVLHDEVGSNVFEDLLQFFKSGIYFTARMNDDCNQAQMRLVEIEGCGVSEKKAADVMKYYNQRLQLLQDESALV